MLSSLDSELASTLNRSQTFGVFAWRCPGSKLVIILELLHHFREFFVHWQVDNCQTEDRHHPKSQMIGRASMASAPS